MIPDALEHLLSQRFHGASNIRGIRYQLLYFAWRSFDLYRADDPDAVVGEGLEDVDLHSVRLGNEYVQVKHYGRPMDWGQFTQVIESWGPVLSADPSARFTLVTNARFRGEVDQVQKACSARRLLPPKLRRRLEQTLAQAGVPSVELFLQRVTFLRMAEEELWHGLHSRVVEHFEVSSGNERLYACTLVSRFAQYAGSRVEIRRKDLESVRVSVEEQIARGPVNPAVRDGFVQALDFRDDGNADDYYEGRAARPAHIVLALDIPRPELSEQIIDTLRRVRVGVILASSGQGKSTLALRVAFEHYVPETVFWLQVCRTDSDVGQIAQFLRTRARLGLPLLVLVDNLSERTRLWHVLASELANEQISFLVTAREEDWFRYGNSTAGFTWDLIRPQLRLDEATRIFRELRRRGRVAQGVPSAQWAFEKVHKARLLIEYVYLVTHGTLLEERLAEQIGRFRELDEDPGKLQALRLVSVAQRYGARILAADLLLHSGFREDPQQSLRSLMGEYLSCRDGFCEGLHPVRSEHLIQLLHDPLPVETTVVNLISWLDPENLHVLAGSALADPDLDVRHPLDALVDRCVRSPVHLTGSVARTCFHAEEERYFLRHQSLFDQAYAEGGDGMVYFLAAETMPFGTVNLTRSMLGIDENFGPRGEFILDLATQFSPRIPEQRLEHMFLSRVLTHVPPEMLAADLPALAEILHWCRASDVHSPVLDTALHRSCWETEIFNLSIEHAASLGFALSRTAPEEHRNWTTNQSRLIHGFFKWATRTLAAEEHASGIRIRFPVQVTSNVELNEQAVNRLLLLHQLLPYYHRYDSDGIYLLGEESLFPYDETQKRFSAEKIWQVWDTRRNRVWSEICEDRYAADSVSTWLGEWRSIRERCLEFVTQLYGFYQRAYRGEQATAIQQAALNTLPALVDSLSRLPRPPAALAKTERDRLHKLASDWAFSLQNFLNQFTRHDPNGDEAQSHLMRHNLRDAVHRLGGLEDADRMAARMVGLEPLPGEFSQQERKHYHTLAEALDCWFRRPRDYDDELTQAVASWKQEREASFVSAVRARLEPLHGLGLNLIAPTHAFTEHPLVGICVGLEVRDFRTLGEDVIHIAASVGEVDLEYQFLYIVPLIDRRRFRKEVFRIGKDAAVTLTSGNLPDGLWLLPVEAPPDLDTALPGVQFKPLPEWELIARALQPLERIAWHLALTRVAAENLEPTQKFERRLLDELAQEAAAAEGREEAALDVAHRELRRFMVSPGAQVAWDRVIARCISLKADVQQDPRSAATLLTADIELNTAVQEYLNAAYLNSLSEDVR